MNESVASAPTRPASHAHRSSRLRLELGLALALWRRDMLHLLRERSRWLGVVVQPLLFWLILGGGLGSSFRLAGAPRGVSYLQFLFPGILLMIVLFVMLFATISVIEDRRSGFLQGVLVAPGSRASMVAGKLLGLTTLALVQAAIFLALAPFAAIPLAEARWGLLLVTLLLTCLGLGSATFALAWVSPSAQAYHAIMGVLLLPLWVLSGAMFPGTVGGASPWIGAVMAANPLTYAVNGLRHALAIPGASATAPTSLLALVIFCVVGLALALIACRRQGGRR